MTQLSRERWYLRHDVRHDLAERARHDDVAEEKFCFKFSWGDENKLQRGGLWYHQNLILHVYFFFANFYCSDR